MGKSQMMRRLGRGFVAWLVALALVAGLAPLPQGQAVAAEGTQLQAGSVSLQAATSSAASGTTAATGTATPQPIVYATTALLAADGKLYGCTAAGVRTGSLVNAPATIAAGSNATASTPAAPVISAAQVRTALARVQTLYIADSVKSVGSALTVTTNGTPAAFAGKMSQMTSLKKVVFQATKAANATALQKATATQQKAAAAKRAADAKLKSAKASYTRLTAASKKAATWKKQGSLGFFQYYAQVKGEKGAKEAVRALKRTGYSKRDSDGKLFTSYTKFGAKKDATSMTNFERAVSHIPRGNKLRTNDNHFRGLNTLLVSDVVMAMAQSHANWSDSHLNHAGLAGSDYPVGENLAWNYGSDPYYQWYTEEKLAYEGKAAGQVGHYLNLVEPGHTCTGYAISTKGSLGGWTTYCQQFGYFPVVGERLYTVTQYKARIAAYKKWLKSAASQAKSAKTAYTKAQYSQKVAAMALKDANAKLKSAKARTANGCTAIGASAFAGCKKLTTVQGLEKTQVKTIGKAAFKGCSALKSVKMPYASLAKVGAGAFSGCKKLAASAKPTVSLKAKGRVAKVKAQAYKSGKFLKPAVTVKVAGKKLKRGTHYTVTYANNYKRGTATISITGKGKYYGTKTVRFKIK